MKKKTSISHGFCMLSFDKSNKNVIRKKKGRNKASFANTKSFFNVFLPNKRKIVEDLSLYLYHIILTCIFFIFLKNPSVDIYESF